MEGAAQQQFNFFSYIFSLSRSKIHPLLNRCFGSEWNLVADLFRYILHHALDELKQLYMVHIPSMK
jgi:hypothetical protein